MWLAEECDDTRSVGGIELNSIAHVGVPEQNTQKMPQPSYSLRGP